MQSINSKLSYVVISSLVMNYPKSNPSFSSIYIVTANSTDVKCLFKKVQIYDCFL